MPVINVSDLTGTQLNAPISMPTNTSRQVVEYKLFGLILIISIDRMLNSYGLSPRDRGKFVKLFLNISIYCDSMRRISNETLGMQNIRLAKGIISLVIDGKHIQRKLADVSPLLAIAEESELNEFELSPSGYGIHCTLIDEYISIDGLLACCTYYVNSRARNL